MNATAYVALGSNLGDRQDNLCRALEALRGAAKVAVTQVSSFLETLPVGGPPGQPNYLNGAAELHTDLGPRELLETLLAIEQRLGRVRQEPNGPRTVDLDLLLYDDLILQEPGLIVPHPRMHERGFVLKPLAEIAPRVVHPVLKATVLDLLLRLPESVNRGQSLTGLRAAVTGSTSGIGLAMARELAGAGARVILHGRWPRSVVESLPASSGPHHLILADIQRPEECHRLIETAWAEWDGLDIWINNAGADTLTGAAARWTFEQKLDELLAVDVKAAVYLARAVGQRMKERGRGAIVNVGWDQAETGMEGDSGQLFGIAKAAVMAFTKSLALSLAPEVRVNCLAPGWIRTAWGATASEVWQERVRRETPLRRWGTPEDVAAAACWLVSPAAAFLTGQIIRVNGGAVR